MVKSETGDEIGFGPFLLSRRRRALTGESGPVTLGARAFDLLLTLLDRPGQLLSKHELLDLVWPGLAVEENNLHVQMVALRRALGPHHGLIQTVPGRGYRFAGELSHPAPGEAAPAPPPLPRAAEHNLPAELSVLIGRDAELAELRGAMRQSRLVTLTGPSGIGKTRLAVALAHLLAPEFPGGIRLIDLAPLADAALVAGAAAAALGLRLEQGAAPENIAAALGERPCLLLFDNCEHLLDAAAPLAAALLKHAPTLSIMATSQEPLRIEAETIFRLDPLAVPPRDSANLEQFGAAALFLRRVEAADRRFHLTPENAAAVAEICRRLDGIPLALEMAAARVPAFGIEGLRARLDDRLQVLTSGARTADARHRTLRGTVAWSHDLLDAQDQAIFRRLGIFAGGFTADAAVAVLRDEPDDDWTLFDALFRLIDKSLVVAEPGETPRYRLLETLRLFALEKLDEHQEHAAYAARHAAFFEAFFTRAYDDWEATPDAAWLAAMAPELDNARAALDWALDSPPAHHVALSLAGAAALLWDKTALLTEGRRYLERAEALASPATPPAILARLHRQIGNFWHGADRPRALAALMRAEALYRAIPDAPQLGATLALIGPVRSFLGQQAEAEAALTEARAILSACDRPKSLLNVFNNLGVQAAITGDMASARDLFEQALSLSRRSVASEGEVLMLVNLAEIEFNLGQTAAAVDRTNAAVAALRKAGQQADLGWALVNLATYLLIDGRLAEAAAAAREALSLVRPVGGFILRACLQQWALLAASAGDLPDAARLAGFADAGYQQAGEPRQPTEQRVYDDLRAMLHSALPEKDIFRLTAEGATLSEAQAVALAAHLSTRQARR